MKCVSEIIIGSILGIMVLILWVIVKTISKEKNSLLQVSETIIVREILLVKLLLPAEVKQKFIFNILFYYNVIINIVFF